MPFLSAFLRKQQNKGRDAAARRRRPSPGHRPAALNGGRCMLGTPARRYKPEKPLRALTFRHSMIMLISLEAKGNYIRDGKSQKTVSGGCSSRQEIANGSAIVSGRLFAQRIARAGRFICGPSAKGCCLQKDRKTSPSVFAYNLLIFAGNLLIFAYNLLIVCINLLIVYINLLIFCIQLAYTDTRLYHHSCRGA